MLDATDYRNRMDQSSVAHDTQIRRELVGALLGRYREEPGCLVVGEMGVLEGRARADVAVINGCLHGYEIKAARDTMARLPAQAEAYSKVFDYMTLVTTENHVPQALRTVPTSWGIALARPSNSGVQFEDLRRAERNLQVEARALLQLLWRDEALAVLERMGRASGVKSKARAVIWSRLEDSLAGVEEVGELVRSTLKRRSDWG
jgi:hypothetical protein